MSQNTSRRTEDIWILLGAILFMFLNWAALTYIPW